MKLPHERFDYSAMPQREPLRFPNGERIAVYMIVNIEEWNIEKPVAREYVTSPAGVVTVPNVPQLVLARVRHAGRCLAHHGCPGRAPP